MGNNTGLIVGGIGIIGAGVVFVLFYKQIIQFFKDSLGNGDGDGTPSPTPTPTPEPEPTPTPTPTPTPVPTGGDEKTFPLPKFRDSSDSRTVLKTQMQLPNGTWSNEIYFNYDTGASWATDVPLELLSGFGSSANGVASSARKEQTTKIRIVGFPGEYSIPVVIQDKAHYDLLRTEKPPTRYPLLRVRDLLPYLSFVFTNKDTTIRTKGKTIPQLNSAGKITLPDMASRSGTPTSGWQWIKVNFVNPSDSSKKVNDWLGLNTGDRRMIIKKESVVDKLGVSQSSTSDSDEFDATVDIEFAEATPVTTLKNVKITSRKESASFGRGGIARNLGGGLEFLNKYTLILDGYKRYLVPSTTSARARLGNEMIRRNLHLLYTYSSH